MMIFLTLSMAFADDVSAESSSEKGENTEVQESDVQTTSVETPEKIETSTQPVTNIVESILHHQKRLKDSRSSSEVKSHPFQVHFLQVVLIYQLLLESMLYNGLGQR